MPVAGNLVIDAWTVLDGADAPLTGMLVPGDVTLTLLRQSGSAMIAASEVISWTEIGATGRYYLSFTPLASGLYVLILREINAGSALRINEFRYQVSPGGAIFLPSYANAYCAETDIERWLQQQITASTKPTDTEAAGFAEAVASVLSSRCASLGFPVTPATIVPGSNLQDVLREANAIGAALYYAVAQTFGVAPSKSDRVTELQAQWDRYYGTDKIVGLLTSEVRGSLASLATNQILSGDTQAAVVTAPAVDVGIQFHMSDLL